MRLNKICSHEYRAICTEADEIFYICTVYAYSIREAIELCEELDFSVNSIIEIRQINKNESPRVLEILYQQNIDKSDIIPCEVYELKWYVDRKR